MAALVLSLLFSLAAGTNWYLGKNVNLQQIADLTSHKRYYGTYGQGLSLFSDSPNFQFLGTVSKLCVIETSKGISTSVKEQLVSNEMALLHQEANILIVASEKTCQNLNLNTEILNVISVPSSPYRQRETARVFPRPTAPNDAISDALAKVSKENLNATVTSLSSIHSRQSGSVGAKEAQLWLAGQLDGMGYHVRFNEFNPSYSSNVIATLNGTRNPDQCLYVGAHYDSRGPNESSTTDRAPGADDNASGTSAVLEIARIVKLENFQFAYSLCFALFSGEEQGLLGSRAMASQLAPGSVLAMLNADMLGWKLPNVTITLGQKDRYVTPSLVSASNAITAIYVPELPIANSSSCCSDYMSFYENGFEAMGFFENNATASANPNYHKASDLANTVNYDQMVLHTKAILASLLTFGELV